jgi:integrase
MTKRASHKQGQGQGSISELKRGVWRVRAPVIGYTDNGSPIQPGAVVHGTKAEALEKLDELRGAKRSGVLSKSTHTVGDFLARWVETSTPRWAISTARRNAGIVDRILVPALGKIKLRDLNAGHLASLYGSLTTKGEAPATVNRVHAVIARACSDAVAWGELGTSPAPAAKSARPRMTTKEPRPYTTEEVDALQAELTAAGPMWSDLIELAASTGLRRSELCALVWSDIDTKSGEILVAHGLDYRNRDEWSFKAPKSEKVRLVPLTGSARDALDRQYSRASSTAPSAFIFSETPDGKTPIDPDRVSKVARTARVAAGIPDDVKPMHALRGWFITEIGSKVSAREAQALAGHASIVTTELYLGRGRDDTAKAVAAIDAARKPTSLSADG